MNNDGFWINRTRFTGEFLEEEWAREVTRNSAERIELGYRVASWYMVGDPAERRRAVWGAVMFGAWEVKV